MLDLHMHSQYSGDIDPGEGASVDELCARAVETGLTTIAVTDHCDIDGIYEGYFPPLDFEGVRRDVYAAKEKYANRLTLLYGNAVFIADLIGIVGLSSLIVHLMLIENHLVQ